MRRAGSYGWFRSATFWILAVALFAAAAVVFFGDYVYEPFTQLSLRLLVGVSLFFGTLMGVLLYQLYFREETQKRLEEQKELKARNREAAKAAEEQVNDLKARFVEATKIIRNSSIYKGKRDVSYELPWYLMVGGEQEGKTSLLESSGLEFPLNINYERRTVTEAGSTQSFQWYFAEHAIFVDMPGRYIDQKADSVDASVWDAFLQLFKKQRWKRPINGIVLTLSVDTLMERTEKELEQYAKGLRDRFDELSETFMSTIPIYLFVTKSDRVPGFSEYFATLSEEEREEVLGMTFDDREQIDSSVVQPELDALIQRLNSSVLDRMHGEWDSAARAKILLFGSEFSALFEKLKMFIDMSFARTRYRAPLMLRGIYFTSVPPAQVPLEGAPAEGALPAAATGAGFFVHKVLREIIFPEADIIKMDTTYRKTQKGRQWGAFAASLLIVALVTAFWIRDFNDHTDRLNRLESMVKGYVRDRDHIEATGDFEKSLALLNRLYTAKTSDDVNRSGQFWKLAFFNVEERQEKLDRLYREALEKILLPYAGRLMEAQVAANLDDYERTWDSTKAYLMLNNEPKRNAPFLEQWMATTWSHLYPNKLSVQSDLNAHWQRLLGYGFAPFALNEDRVEAARNRLLGFGHEALVYKQLQEKVQQSRLKSFRFSQVMGSNTAAFRGNDYLIPGLYTKEGYAKIIVKDGKKLVDDLVRSNWVVGYSTELSDAELNEMYAKVQSFYFTDYKKHWLTALNALQIPRKRSIAQISNQLTVLTSADSPIVAVLKALREHTELYTPLELQAKAAEENLATATRVASMTRASRVASAAAANVPKVRDNTSAKNLREFFRKFHRLLTDEGQPEGRLKTAMERLEQSFKETTAMNGSVTPHRDAFKLVIDRINGRHGPVVMKTSTLPVPVSKWFKKVLRNNWGYIVAQSKRHINDRYEQEVFAYYKAKLAGRYPLDNTSERDIALGDFEEFFKKEGVVDRFYASYVAPFVKLDPANRTYRMRNIDGTSIGFDEHFFDSIFVKEEIRKRFFTAKGDALGTTLQIKPSALGRNLATMALRYDDTYIAYEHGPIKSKKLYWPSESESVTATFQLFDLENSPVASYSAEGEWALYKLLKRMKVQQEREKRGNGSLVVEHDNSRFKAAFALEGPSAEMLGSENPLQKYTLGESL
jgi:type VI secretion system protein ImpL